MSRKRLTDDEKIAIFKESKDYSEFRIKYDLMGSNKAAAHRWLQSKLFGMFSYSYDGRQKAADFVRDGYMQGEIPLSFIWNAIGCTNIKKWKKDRNENTQDNI